MKQSSKTGTTANRDGPEVTGSRRGNKRDFFYLFIIIIIIIVVVVMSFRPYTYILLLSFVVHKTSPSISYGIHAGLISQRNTSARITIAKESVIG